MNKAGSEWNRWDMHIHTPGTLHEDEFQGGWEEYEKHIDMTDYSNMYVDTWQKAKAQLGPHLVQVSTIKAMESECEIHEEVY